MMKDIYEKKWLENYKLAKNYFEQYGDLEIPANFKTKDGCLYDEDGTSLGMWIQRQKQAYRKHGTYKITEDRVKLLESIGIDFSSYCNEENWQENYALAKIYHKHYDNLEIPVNFKTKDGYTYDKDGVSLGKWVVTQRQTYKGKNNCVMSFERIKLLESIDIKWFSKNMDIKLQKELITKENKISKNQELLNRLYSVLNEMNTNSIDVKEINNNFMKVLDKSKVNSRKISNLGANEMRDIDNYKWYKNYYLIKNYYEQYGNLEIPERFKTLDGYTYDEDGVALGMWIVTQRQAYKGNSSHIINDERILLLQEIGFNFDIDYYDKLWMEKYKLAKNYFEKYGDLEIPQKFKTKDGRSYDKDGIALGAWINDYRMAYKGKNFRLITPERISLLENIGMRFETNYYEKIWQENYKLAKNYYECYDNLKIPINFKTIDGYTYNKDGLALGRWITTQRQVYKGKKAGSTISLEKIKLLENIGMKWFSDNMDIKLQKELITEENKSSKNQELLNRLYSVLNQMDTNNIDITEINNTFMDALDKPKVKKKSK